VEVNFDNRNEEDLRRVLIGNPEGKRPLEKKYCVNTDHEMINKGVGEACWTRCGRLSCRGGGDCGTASGRRD
jgi:hypothetical protein